MQERRARTSVGTTRYFLVDDAGSRQFGCRRHVAAVHAAPCRVGNVNPRCKLRSAILAYKSPSAMVVQVGEFLWNSQRGGASGVSSIGTGTEAFLAR